MSELCTVAIGGVEEAALREVEACVAEHLGCGVRRLSPLALPAGSFDEQRGQWNSVLLLRQLLAAAPSGCVRILGVTECDLFIPMLTFVFGQAQLNGLAALVSMARLRQEFHGFAPDAEVLRARVRKEAMHELGHTFGLIHCPEPECVMSLSIQVQQVDTKYEWYCDGCGQAVRERVTELRNH